MRRQDARRFCGTRPENNRRCNRRRRPFIARNVAVHPHPTLAVDNLFC